MKDLCLVCTAYHKKDLTGLHDGSDTHGIRLLGHVVNGCKETLIGLNGALGQVHAVCGPGEILIRLIKTNMAVVSKAQQLKVNAALSFNYILIPGALFFAVRFCSVRNIGILHVNINVFEKVIIHEIVVALVVILCQAPVFIQVHALCC